MSASVCPDNGVVEGLAGYVVPDDGCFALVGDSDCFDGFGGMALVFEGLDGALNACFNGRDELEGVVLVPSVVESVIKFSGAIGLSYPG